MTTLIDIGPFELSLAALLILLNMGISIWLRLGLARNLALAALRMTVQLLLVGFILESIFALNHPVPVLGMCLLMASLAGVSAVRRTKRRFAGIYFSSLFSVLAASSLVTGAAVTGILRVEPWFTAQYLIPLLGMVLGNALNGISLALDRFMEGVLTQRDRIETSLTLGASRWEAAHFLVRDSLRTGMIPVINSMMVMGLVSLPGMMTGQILAGAAPADAVRYQIVITFMIAASSALGAFGVTVLAFFRLFSASHQLRATELKDA